MVTEQTTMKCAIEMASNVRASVVEHLNKRYLGVRSRHVSDLLEQIRAKAILRGVAEAPAWLELPPGNWPSSECLPTRNAIVHFPSLVEGREPSKIAATPALFTMVATEFALDLEAARRDA